MATKKEIKAYIKRCAKRAEDIVKREYDPQDPKTSTQDMLTNILHLCNVKGWDYYEIFDDARMHANAETHGGEHG